MSCSKSDLFSDFITNVRDKYNLLEPEDLKWVVAELKRVHRAADKMADENPFYGLSSVYYVVF